VPAVLGLCLASLLLALVGARVLLVARARSQPLAAVAIATVIAALPGAATVGYVLLHMASRVAR
jgi:hypothetical protein